MTLTNTITISTYCSPIIYKVLYIHTYLFFLILTLTITLTMNAIGPVFRGKKWRLIEMK